MIERDLIGRQDLVTHLTRVLVDDDLPKHGAHIVALVGPWGAGKSWTVDQVRPFLPGPTRSFNPWLFSDDLRLFQGFAALVLERIQDKRARRRIGKVLDYVGPSLKGFGFDLSGSVSTAAKALKGMNSPEEIRTAIIKATRSGLKRSYIILDDLDRLTPEELLIVFKLLRLVGDLPGLVYVLVYDEATLLRLMMRTQIAYGSMERARTYLEKIVETKILVPPISDATKRKLILEPLVVFGRHSQRHFEDTDIAHKVETLLFPKLHTIRVAERFVSSVCLLPEKLHGELRYLDWILITFLRSVEPHAYEVIQKYPSVFLANNSAYVTISADQTTSTAKRVATELISETSSESHGIELLEIVDELFPLFASLRIGINSRRVDTGQEICSAQYFARYFGHGLPAGSVSDVEIEAGLNSLSTFPIQASGVEKLTTLLSENPHEVVMAIGRRWQWAASAPQVFNYLATIWAHPALNYTTGMFQTSAKVEVTSVALGVLRHFSNDDLVELEKPLSESTSPDTLLIHALDRIGTPAGSAYFVDWVNRAQTMLADVAASQILSATSPINASSQMEEFFWILRRRDEIRSRQVILRLLASKAVRPSEVLIWLLTESKGADGSVTGISVLQSIYDDQELVNALTSPECGTYPPEWADVEVFHSAMQNEHEKETVANYILDDWTKRALG